MTRSSPNMDVLRAALGPARLRASAPVLLRDGANTLYQLADGTVARIGKRGSVREARREVAVALWLLNSGISVVRPQSGMQQPTIVGDRPITWWQLIPDHRPGTPAELGAVVQRLHQLPVPQQPWLPPLNPFGTAMRQVMRAADHLDPGDRDWLGQRIDELEQRFIKLRDTETHTVVHGDAWQGNVAVTTDGTATLLDLEHVSIGLPQWDLLPIAVDHTDFARFNAADYRGFVEAYGYDVTTWPHYRTLADIQELRWVAFTLSRAPGDERAADEAQHRIACLRGRIPPPWEWSAF